MGRSSRLPALGLILLGLALPMEAATFVAQGTNLTVTTTNIQVSFSGADVVGITNQLTSERYLRNPSPNMQLNLTLVQPPSQGLAASGVWTVNGSSASLSFTDSNRTVNITVTVDPTTQEVVVNLNGTAKNGGVEQLIWGVTGFDLAIGKFVLPGWGGMAITSASFKAQSSYGFFGDAWDAPMSLFQGSLGGVNIYSTDTQSLCKDVLISANQQQTANQLFYVEAQGPYNSATAAGAIEWRLSAYQGDWQAGARIYRDWHAAVAPPVALTGGRAWASKIRTVIEEDGSQPYQTSDLDSLAGVLVPSETLLYIVSWRPEGYDIGYPDYSWVPSLPAFIAYAHKLGFYVMLHTDVLGVATTSSDYASMLPYQLKDPRTLELQGWNWSLPVSTPQRYGLINPAASAWRSRFITRVSPAIQTLQPDAIHLDFTIVYNDGNGLIEGLNFNQGLAQMQRDLLTAFPNLVLGVEEINDAIAAQATFGQPIYWTALNLDPAVTPPLPVSAYVLPNVRRYWHLGVPNPYESSFVANLAQYEAQAVLPTFHTNIADYSQPDLVRFLNAVHAFQNNNLQPAWDTPWNGAVVKYQGSTGVTATLTDSGTLVQFATQQSSTATTVYQRAHGVNQVSSSLSVTGWPAYNGNLTLGLDPANQYWLDNIVNNPALPHITGLPSGARIGLGAGTLVTPQFAYFQLLPPAAASFDFFSNLWLANQGVTFSGADFPLQNGATAFLTQMTVGGVTRQAIFTQPPFTAQRGGDVFFEYAVPIPASGGASLSFAAGINDAAIGQRQGPLTFKVAINGSVAWQQDISTGGWQAGSIDLKPYLGQTIQIRFITDPGPSGNPNFGWGGWSVLQLAVAGDDTLSGISIAVPATVAAKDIVTSGGTVSVNNGTAAVNGIPSGSTVLVFTGQPVSISAGQSLLNIPFTLSQSSTGKLAGPALGAFAGTGVIAPTTSGGVTKQQTLFAFAPANGQTIFSWLLKLPASPGLAFSFSAGYWDGRVPNSQGYLMSVRINGTTLWQQNINVPAAWNYGSLGLSQWGGQTVLVELITDSQGPNYNDFTSWAELSFSTAGGSNCSTSLSGYGPLNIPPGGASGSITVTTAAGCHWTAGSQSDWITATPSGSSGNGAVNYTVAPNLGPARSSLLVIAGNEIAVSQDPFCAITFQPTNASAAAAGGPASVNFTAGCAWTASSNASWLTINSGGSGTGNGTVSYSVAQNLLTSARSGTITVSGQAFTVIQAGLVTNMSLSQAALNFGGAGSVITSPQTVALSFSGGAALAWTASSNQPNVTVSPASGTGSGTVQVTASAGPSAIITVTAAGASNSPLQIQVNVASVTPAPPFGSFDTPANNTSGVSGSIAVTGWALDSIEVNKVDIWREPVGTETPSTNGLVYIGDAVFVAGARPDVQSANPNAPFNYRAGWGYLMLTTGLPANGGSTTAGNGTYKLHAIAHNKTGAALDLGTRTITVDNAHSTKPFGTIDTPDQGATVSGSQFINFGWALAQNPNCIPTNGSTLTVTVDGVTLGHPTYNQNRADLAAAFPGRCNSAGAAGYFFIDTTKLANGVHTIGWLAYDDHGNGDGLGSRFFNVLNSGGGVAASDEPVVASAPHLRDRVDVEELGRLELQVGAVEGYLEAGGERQALPVGSTLKGGVFYWQLGPGFHGSYPLVFLGPDGSSIRVKVTVVPKTYR